MSLWGRVMTPLAGTEGWRPRDGQDGAPPKHHSVGGSPEAQHGVLAPDTACERVTILGMSDHIIHGRGIMTLISLTLFV